MNAIDWHPQEREGEISLPSLSGGMVALQAGVLAPVPVVIGIACTASHQVLPTDTLSRTVRLWRYPFIAAAAGLGVWGMALLLFALMMHVATVRGYLAVRLHWIRHRLVGCPNPTGSAPQPWYTSGEPAFCPLEV